MIFESHAHYDDEAFDEDREVLLDSMQAHGVERIINVCAEVQNWDRTLNLTEKYPFIHVDKGTGMNKGTANEGIRDHNFFATYLVGPFLILNPLFTKYLLNDVMKLDAKLAFEPVIMQAYERRVKEFNDPKTEF